MIDNIEYIEEEVREEIFEGTYILDGLRMSEEQQKQKVYDLMRQAGVEFNEDDELIIGYEGADDDFGISETQSTKFVVTKVSKKKIPYKVTREEIFEGTYVLDGLRITEEQQKEKIFELMRVAGVEIPNEEDIEIGYEGADDDYGISETQSTKFVVYKKVRTKLEDSEVRASSDDMSKVLADLKELREKLNSAEDEITKNNILAELADRTNSLEKILYNFSNNELTAEIEKIDEELKNIEKQLKASIKQYEDSYEKMRAILKEQNDKLDGMEILDDSEYEAFKEEYLEKKYEENEHAIAIKKEIDIRKKQIATLKRRKNAIKKDLMNASALDITIEQYQNITNTLVKRKILNAILEEKGLNDIIMIPAKERTKEQKELLKATKEEIIKQIAELQKQSDGEMSVIDAIEALYNFEVSAVMVKKPRGIKVTPEALDTIRENTELLPEKFVDRIHVLNKDEVFGSINVTQAPDDMFEANENVNNEGYHEEVVREVVFTGRIALGEEDLYDAIARDFGIDIRDNPDFEVEYDGASDDYGISETQLLDYRIVKLTRKMVKDEEVEENDDDFDYEEVIEREEVFRGEIIIGEEDIFDVILRDHGIDIRGNEDYEIGYEGADDNYGISESQTTKYVVFKLNKKLVKKPKPKTVPDTDPEPETTPDTKPDTTPQPDPEPGPEYDESGLIEVITLYVDADNNNEVYGRKYLFERFNMNYDSDPTRIDGALCYRIAQNDVDYILQNANNENSPYKIRVREIHMGRRVVDTPDDDMNNRLTEERVTLFIDTNNNNEIYGRSYIFERFNIEPIGEEVRIDGALCYRMSSEDANFIISNQTNDYSPYVVEQREVSLAKRIPDPVPPVNPDDLGNEVIDRFSIFVDENDKKYVRKNVFERFNIEPIGNDVRIDGALCYEISDNDVDNIIHNQDNDYSPYEIRVLPITNDKIERPMPTPPTYGDDDTDSVDLGRDVVDQVTVFRDTNTNRHFVRKNSLTRFDIEPVSEEVRIEGASCFEISDEDFERLMNNQNNDFSPYKVRIKDISLGKDGPGIVPDTKGPGTDDPTPGTKGPGTDDPTPDTKGPGTDDPTPGTKGPGDDPEVREVTIVLYKDVDTNNIYAAMNVLNLARLTPNGTPEMIDGKACYLLSEADHNTIKNLNYENTRFNIVYKPVSLKKEAPKKYGRHVEEILDDLTTDLDIHAKDAKKFTASNIKVGKILSDSVHTGNFLYNIVGFVPGLLKAGFALLRKIGSKLTLGKRGKDSMEELQRRLNELSEEDLEVLFNEYRGSLLKTDMNNQINPLIMAKLKEYGMAKVAKLNDAIRVDYTKLFALLGEIRALEERMANEKDQSKIETYAEGRRTMLGEAAQAIERIMGNRVEANNLLSGGIHGLEEDFKAVASKMNYVGFRFGKTNNFDNELQHLLGEYGRGLRESLNARDNEGIVDNFMGLESLYYENTEIRGSLFGKRSVGSKYYSPIAEEFDYRDDPFIRDLLTTVAVTSAAVSAVNAIRIEQMVKHANSQNQATIDSVHQAANDITGKSDTMREGMEAQAHQDVLNGGNVIERTELDYTNWSFNNAYHAADAQGHAFFNQFNADVQNQISQVTQQYASGAISQADALKAMAQISNDAQSTLGSVTSGCIDIFRQYAQTHPQFDLTAIEQSMAYITAHPDAIIEMNNGIVDIMATAETLKGLGLAQVPSDLLTTLICACSATGLALNVTREMQKKYTGKVEYGNDITDMMDDYVRQIYGDEDELADDLDEDLDDDLVVDLDEDLDDDLVVDLDEDLDDEDTHSRGR